MATSSTTTPTPATPAPADVEIAGATTTADGITSRPDYAYAPPAEFFAPGAPAAGLHVFNVADYGAVADPAVNNAPMIQAAIQAAHDAGGGLVYIPPGVYGIAGTDRPADGGVRLLDNVFLKGAGMGETTLRVVDGFDKDLTGIVRSPTNEITKNFGVADLSLDGNRDHNPTGKIDGYYCGVQPNDTRACEDAYVLRVEALNNRGYGFDPHEQTQRLTIEDSVAHHNGLDGFTEDFQVDAVIKGNLAYANDRHGFNIVTTTNDSLFLNNVARDNGGSGFTVQRGSFDIPTPHNVVIEGGQSFGNRLDGINVRLSSDIKVHGVDIHGNGQAGVQLDGSSHVTLDGNTIAGNSMTKAGAFAEVQINSFLDTKVTGTTFHGDYNLVANNIMTTASGISPASSAVQEVGTQVDHNVIAGNTLQIMLKGLVQLVGANTTVDQAGTAGADTVTLNSGNDKFVGGAGDDVVHGGAGNDTLDGGLGNDRLFGDAGDDQLVASAGSDTYDGGAGTDSLDLSALVGHLTIDVARQLLSVGGAGPTAPGTTPPVVPAATPHQWFHHDKATPWWHHGAVHKALAAQATHDTTRAAGDSAVSTSLAKAAAAIDPPVVTSAIVGVEKFIGNDAGDTFKGGAANEWFHGGRGFDAFTGGAGADTFEWTRHDLATGSVDRVTDFQAGLDKLDLSEVLANAPATMQGHATTSADIVRLSATTDHGTKVEVLVGTAWKGVAVLDGLDAAHLTLHDLGL